MPAETYAVIKIKDCDWSTQFAQTERESLGLEFEQRTMEQITLPHFANKLDGRHSSVLAMRWCVCVCACACVA